ncbi:ferredoxin family protein [Halanaerobium sp. MA284_MarDTE_T2]|uniref:4Fe-4S dicluster domain-containing protein n=1 Tax=Halanaerobium sp. MA284_MarDTE_T2 TaxID=2183913 RepID=UPI000DF2F780|nr:4Fe-4S binding protein [Halanaerobium sp. MA284_MarDTE_T2]RCW48620.1 2-oxoglutarate ferredoxin oxidoreductase subunit delta [Halanaerobium sp. MA284_MarDTE_T2]
MSKSKNKAKIEINQAWCKSCGICVDFCPTDVLELDITGKLKVVEADACINCMLCELRCPDFAIEIVEED